VVKLVEAKRIYQLLRRKGLNAEYVGGLFKGKEVLHDIDLIVRYKDAVKDIDIIKRSKIRAPIELYIVDDSMYVRLRKALRATTYEAIQGRLMKGLQYKRMAL
jgi:hypothetical protein